MIKKENAITLIALVITIAKYGKNSKKACNLGKKLI